MALRKREDTYNVPGLEKGLQIIELLSRKNSGLTLQDVVREVEVTPTTAYRILSTLVRMEYVNYSEKGKIYRLTRKMLRLGYQVLGEHDLMEHLLPALRSLRDVVKESVFFGVLNDEKGVLIEQAQGIYPFKFVLSQGASFELHNSAPGKAMLAFLPTATREYYLDKINYQSYTPYTITTRSAYVKELEKVRQQGYATDFEETFMGVICIGAPVFNFEGLPIGAIWVSGPNLQLTVAEHEYKHKYENIVENLLKTTRALSLELGYVAE